MTIVFLAKMFMMQVIFRTMTGACLGIADAVLGIASLHTLICRCGSVSIHDAI